VLIEILFFLICNFFKIMGGSEIFFILLVVVMLFGADKVPELARGLGKGMRQLRDATNEVKREINQSAYKKDIDASVSNISKDIKAEVDKLKENVEEYTGPIKRTTKF
jgi:sec-independent protein translocase protein TatA